MIFIAFNKSMTTKGLLPSKFYLDKNFYKLVEEIAGKLRFKDYGEEAERMTYGEFKTIIADVLQLLRPTYEQAIKEITENAKK